MSIRNLIIILFVVEIIIVIWWLWRRSKQININNMNGVGVINNNKRSFEQYYDPKTGSIITIE